MTDICVWGRFFRVLGGFFRVLITFIFIVVWARIFCFFYVIEDFEF